MSYLTQMLALTVQNFVSAAAGMAIARRRSSAAFDARSSRETVGNFWVDLDAQHALHPAAAVARSSRSSWSRRAWSRTSAPTQTVRARRGDDRRATASRCTEQSACAHGARRVAGRDQAARHQRRRLLQRELGASVRESDAALQLPRGCSRSCSSPAALCYTFGKMVERHAPGLGGARRDDRSSSSPLLALCVGAEQAGNPRLARARRRPRPRAPLSPAATWRARRCASASPTRRSGRPRRRPRRTARSTRCTTRSRRSAASCPMLHDAARARWSTAASARGSTACWRSRSSRCSSPASWWAARPSTSARRSRRTR